MIWNKSTLVHRITPMAILLCFAVIVSARMPSIVLDGGRFWAEEGTVYFSNAWKEPWYQSWFAVAYDAGYINLAAGLGTWLGLHLGGVGHAPAVTVAIALLIQCLPAYLLITHEFPWHRAIGATMVAVVMCAIPPVTGEVWLNTTNSQFHLALCTALIFAAPPRTRILFYCDCVILGLAVLSGPASTFLMPLFVLAAVRQRDPKSTMQAAIIVFGFLIQITVFLLHPLSLRNSHLGPAALLSVVSLHTIVLQFAGVTLANGFARYLGSVHAAHGFLAAGAACAIVFYGVVGAGIWRSRNLVLAKLYVAGLIIALVSFDKGWGFPFDGFMNLIVCQRYAFAPMVINALLLVGLATISRGAWRGVFVVATCVVLFVGSTEYRNGLLPFAAGPVWQPQVAAWRGDPSHRLTVWPGWALALVPRPR